MVYFRTKSGILFLILLTACLVLLWWECGAKPIGLAALAALLVYVILHLVFNWTVPRRHHHLPAFIVCFIGAYLFSLAAGRIVTELPHVFAVAAAGAFLFLYMAVKVGVPSTLSLLVCCDAVSSNDKLRDDSGEIVPDLLAAFKEMLRRKRFLRKLDFTSDELGASTVPGPKGPPWVWPYHFEVAMEGTVSWILRGKPKTKVRIVFDQGFDPFSFGDPSEFRGKVPETIIAGPVVRAGRGNYRVCMREPRRVDDKGDVIEYGEERCVILGGGGSQQKHP